MFDSIKNAKTFEKRLQNTENTVHVVNKLVNTLIIETNEKIGNVMHSRNTEETILKYNFSMLDAIFEPLKPDKAVNMDIHSQLKINYATWKAEVRELFDLGKFSDDDISRFQLFGQIKLKKAGELRKELLHFSLNARRLKKKPRRDIFGKIRRNSFDGNKQALK